MIEVIIILACIGALYQWRNTDFVKAILMTLLSVATALIALFAIVATADSALQPILVVLYVVVGGIVLYRRRVQHQANQFWHQANLHRPQPMSEPVDEPID
jgi:uncharacterized membrane protein YqgA involved in biofilm formation